MMLRETLFVFAAFLVLLATATEVSHCGSGKPYDDPNEVVISGCDKPPCRLRKKTKISVEQKFVPDRDVESLVTSVHATLLGVPLPFVGVDGTNACGNVYDTEGNQVGCPLKKGVPYVYKNGFPVLEIYPKVSVVVHYALMEGNDVITCFEVPSKITN